MFLRAETRARQALEAQLESSTEQLAALEAVRQSLVQAQRNQSASAEAARRNAAAELLALQQRHSAEARAWEATRTGLLEALAEITFARDSAASAAESQATELAAARESVVVVKAALEGAQAEHALLAVQASDAENRANVAEAAVQQKAEALAAAELRAQHSAEAESAVRMATERRVLEVESLLAAATEQTRQAQETAAHEQAVRAAAESRAAAANSRASAAEGLLEQKTELLNAAEDRASAAETLAGRTSEKLVAAESKATEAEGLLVQKAELLTAAENKASAAETQAELKAVELASTQGRNEKLVADAEVDGQRIEELTQQIALLKSELANEKAEPWKTVVSSDVSFLA